MDTKEKPPLMSLAEVAEVVRVSQRTITRLVKLGEIPAPIRFGRSLRFRREEVMAAIGSVGR